jgi:hypothetical protein
VNPAADHHVIEHSSLYQTTDLSLRNANPLGELFGRFQPLVRFVFLGHSSAIKLQECWSCCENIQSIGL